MPASFEIDSTLSSNALIYRLDARTKMGIGLAASIAVLFFSHPASLGFLILSSFIYVALLKRRRMLLIVYGIVLAMWGTALVMLVGAQWLFPQMEALDPAKVVNPFLRTLVMLNVTLVLALSSRIQNITAALTTLRLPFIIHIPLVVMVRFIPTFIDDVRQIRECIRTRGHRMTPGAWLSRPGFNLRLVLVPLIFRSLRSADELGVAAELKGLGRASSLTPMRQTRFRSEDVWVGVTALTSLSLSVALQLGLSNFSWGMIG